MSVARPTAIEMTSNCRMLNEMLVLALPSLILVLPDRARLLRQVFGELACDPAPSGAAF